jgi:hypothetical protein
MKVPPPGGRATPIVGFLPTGSELENTKINPVTYASTRSPAEGILSMKKITRKTKKHGRIGGAAPPMADKDPDVARGLQAWQRLKEAGRTSWADWILIGIALMAGRQYAMEIAKTNKLKSKRYIQAFHSGGRDSGWAFPLNANNSSTSVGLLYASWQNATGRFSFLSHRCLGQWRCRMICSLTETTFGSSVAASKVPTSALPTRFGHAPCAINVRQPGCRSLCCKWAAKNKSHTIYSFGNFRM